MGKLPYGAVYGWESDGGACGYETRGGWGYTGCCGWAYSSGTLWVLQECEWFPVCQSGDGLEHTERDELVRWRGMALRGAGSGASVWSRAGSWFPRPSWIRSEDTTVAVGREEDLCSGTQRSRPRPLGDLGWSLARFRALTTGEGGA